MVTLITCYPPSPLLSEGSCSQVWELSWGGRWSLGLNQYLPWSQLLRAISMSFTKWLYWPQEKIIARDKCPLWHVALSRALEGLLSLLCGCGGDVSGYGVGELVYSSPEVDGGMPKGASVCVCEWERYWALKLLGHPTSKSCVGIRWGCEIWTRSGLLWDAGFFPLPLFLGPRDDGEASFPIPFFNHLLQELSKMKMNGQCQPQAPGNVKEEDNWRHWCQSRSWETS